MSGTALEVSGPHVIAEDFDGEVVIVNLKTGAYYSLRGSGAAVWNLVQQGLTRSDIRAAVAHLYDGPPEEIDAAVDSLLGQLEAEALVRPGAATGPLAPAPPPASRPRFETPTLERCTDMEELLLLDPIHEVDEMGWPARPTRTE